MKYFFFFSSRRRHTRYWRDWSSDVCSSDLEALAAVDGEALDLLTELRAVADEELRGVAVGELREHLGQLRVDRRAVVALHEVLDDELPVGLHVVGDATAHRERVQLVAIDGLHVTEPLGDVAHDVVLER